MAPDVRVIEVRPRDRAPADDEPTTRDWQHRWVVRMHKVRQWYPTEQRHRVLYRGPYIKGPADKPFIAGDIVRGLTTESPPDRAGAPDECRQLPEPSE